jgi:hypothetical protein
MRWATQESSGGTNSYVITLQSRKIAQIMFCVHYPHNAQDEIDKVRSNQRKKTDTVVLGSIARL